MKAALLSFMAVVILVFGFVVLRTFYHGAQYAVAAAAGSAHTNSFSIGGIAPQAYGPYTVHGTVIMDTSHGTPAVPYLEYLDTKHATSTKQLVYMDARACAPSAGDYPCAPTFSATQGYPELTTGEAITVKGYIYEDRFLVQSLTPDR